MYQKVFNLSIICSVSSTFTLVIGSLIASPSVLATSLSLLAVSIAVNIYLLETGRARSGSGNPYDDDVVEEEFPEE